MMLDKNASKTLAGISTCLGNINIKLPHYQYAMVLAYIKAGWERHHEKTGICCFLNNLLFTITSFQRNSTRIIEFCVRVFAAALGPA